MNGNLEEYSSNIASRFNLIGTERREVLEDIADFLKRRIQHGLKTNLLFVCTHNSRRSQFAQIWAELAAIYYKVENVKSFSGGTEVTAFHPNAIHAIQKAGIIVEKGTGSVNPDYDLFSEANEPFLRSYSKLYNDPRNPSQELVAIMTCTEAETNCPFIPEALRRISVRYDDPKAFDNTPEQEMRYDESCKLIATEMFYLFSILK
jgi:protein-tyrosine-phosphatase